MDILLWIFKQKIMGKIYVIKIVIIKYFTFQNKILKQKYNFKILIKIITKIKILCILLIKWMKKIKDYFCKN